MLTINLLENKELKNKIEILKNENTKLKQENVNHQLWVNEFKNECEKLMGENVYLKQRVKEFRHKTWFPVYEENLKLQQELEQYKTVLTSVETFIAQYSKEKKGDKGCH
jgi:chromosome segregation ATPase